jgi:hypothetical protein
MSKNLPETQPSEEIELGHLFKVIGSGIDKVFRFISKTAYKVFILFIWLVFFIKKHIIVLSLALITGFSLGIIKDKYGSKKYSSSAIINQNYNTGEHLYNAIELYNNLIIRKDSTEIARLFDISIEQANKLESLEIESTLDENGKIELFDEFTKGLDSALAVKQKYKEFTKNLKDYSYSTQIITLYSSGKNDFNKIFNQIINKISLNPYFIREQSKDIQTITQREDVINQAIIDADSLKNVYEDVLQKSADNRLNKPERGGQTSITFEGDSDRSKTKEYELLKEGITLKRELVDLDRNKEDLKEIIEIISLPEEGTGGILDNKVNIFELEISRKIAYPLILVLAVLSALLFWEFLKFLERYKERVS